MIIPQRPKFFSSSFFPVPSVPRFSHFLLLLVAVLLAGNARAQRGFPEKNPDLDTSFLRGNNLFMEGLRAKLKGDNKGAMRQFQQYTRSFPNEDAGWYELARLELKNRQVKEAREDILKARKIDGDNKWYELFYVDILILENKYADAAGVLKKLADKDPNDSDVRLKVAALYMRDQKYTAALKEVNEILRLTPEKEEALIVKQEIFLKSNNIDSAVSVARQLVAANPKEARFVAQLAQIYESNGRKAEAEKAYEDAIKAFPEDPGLQLALAQRFQKAGDTAGFRLYVRKAILNKNLDAETQIGLLLPYLQEMAQDSNRKSEGMEIAGELARQYPKDATLQGFYGELLQINNKTEEAAKQFTKVIELDPSRYSAWQQLMFAYTAPKDADSLIAISNRALRLFPTQAMAHYLNGIGYQNKKEYKKAVNAIMRAIDLQPEDNEAALAQMYTSIGDAYNSLKDYKASDDAYDTALSLDPRNVTVLNNYAYYLSVRNVRLSDAEKMSRKSLEVRPDESTFLDTYGWILYQQGKYEQAKKYLQMAIDKSEGEADGTLWDHIGDVHYRLNNKAKAVEAWRKAKEKGADNVNLERKIADGKLYE